MKKWLWINIIFVLILVGIVSVLAYKKSQNSSETGIQVKPITTSTGLASVQTKTDIQTIGAEAIRLSEKKKGYCKALAPDDWAFISNEQATGADLFAPDKTLHAGWGISGVPSNLYANVDLFLKTWMPLAGFTGFSMGEAKDIGDIAEGFVQRDFTSSNGKKGQIFYKVYFAGQPTYVVSVYMADTDSDKWETDGAKAVYSAISIRCVSQLRPTTTNVDISSADASKKSDNPEVSLSDKWTEAIMGYENVYSPTTGDHYEASTSSYWETGPEGGGYYRDLPGGGYEKLERGFGNY